jgi:iron complex outermembrane recepter protein
VNSIKRLLLCGASALAVCSILPIQAFAADDSVETVVVTGVRESLRDSLIAKKNSEVITENISTKDIGQLPDVTIAEELNRLPGLNVVLDRGNASQAAIRGLGPRLVMGLVNGREVASSEPDQNVRWEIYPSEVVNGVQVYKSQTADILSGGIAGTIDIRTLSPLDYDGSPFSIRVGPQYNDEANALPNYTPWGFRGSAAVVLHLTDNLAFYFAGSFQRQKNGEERFKGWYYNLSDSDYAGDVTGDGVADSTPWGGQYEVNELTEDRTAYSAAIQWRPTNNLEIKLDGLYSAYSIDEDQYQQWYGKNGVMGNYTTADERAAYLATNGNNNCNGTSASYYNCSWYSTSSVAYQTVENGVIAGGFMSGSWNSITNVIAKYRERHALVVTGLNAKWTAGDWQVKADLSHSEAYRNNIWMGVETEVYADSFEFYWGKYGKPWTKTYSTWDSTTEYNPSETTIQTLPYYRPGQVSGPEYTRDHVTALTLDTTKAINGSVFTELDFGIRVSDREKNHVNHSWYECYGSGAMSRKAYVALGSQCNSTWTSGTLDSSLLSNFTLENFTAPAMLYGDFDKVAASAYGNYDGFKFSAPSTDTELLNEHWTVNQKTYEGYAKLNFAHDVFGIPMKGNIGLRAVSVKSASIGYVVTDIDTTSEVDTLTRIDKGYTDLLPSLTMNFEVSDDMVVRFGASIAESRPPLDELRVGYSLSTTEPRTGSAGNPKLNPYRADQVDLGYEWYFHEESLLSAAIYYKHLNSFIGYKTTDETYNSLTYAVTKPENGKGGDLTGLELTFQTRFYFIPVGFLQDFGIYANYAYVNSGVKEFSPSANPLEATGLAKHTSELDLWYSAHGLEARIAYKIHSPFTTLSGWNSQQLARVDWERYLDGSVAYQWDDHFGARFQARNITNAHSRSYFDNNSSETGSYDIFGRSFLFDVSYKY